MAKKTSAVISETDVTPAPVVDAAVSAAVTITAENILPAISVDALIAALINPESRASTTQQLDIRIAARRSELEQLEMARRALDPQEIKTVAVATMPESTVKRTASKRTATPITDHASAILSVLKNEKNGLMIADISNKLTDMNHTMDQKSLASYLWSMTKNGKLMKEGDRGSFHYKHATVSV